MTKVVQKNGEPDQLVLPRIRLHNTKPFAVVEKNYETENKNHCSNNNEVKIPMEGDLGTKSTAAETVNISRKCFRTGKTKSIAFREKQLKGLLHFLEERKTDIEDALFKDLRKHKQEINVCEIELVANDLRHTLYEFKQWAKPFSPDKRAINLFDGVYVYNDPYGVVLIVGAWNYPILLTLGPLVGAIAAANTIVLKPSELAPATSKLLQTTLTKYLDPQMFQVFVGDVNETTELLKEKFDYIFFTGSSRIGKIIHEAAAKNLTPCTLELGGKCPVYLDDNADMAKAAKRIMWGRMLNSGQTCVAPDYVLCSKQAQESFLREAKKVIVNFYGTNTKNYPMLSRIINEKHYQRLVNFIRPENIALGGNCNPEGRIISPTILINVHADDDVMKEEIFGPILPIINVKSAEEAIEFINSREKPLALYVFSRNKKVQRQFLKETSSGGVAINDTITQIGIEGLPFGGVGTSGMGCYHGKYGFDTFSHKKGVLVKDFGNLTELSVSARYPPYSQRKESVLKFCLKKRRGISIDFLRNVLVFVLGVVFTIGTYYIWQNIKDVTS